MCVLATSQILQQDEARDDVAVARWRPDANGAGLLQRPRDAIQRLVCQFIRGRAIPPIEIADETSPHLEIGLAMCVVPIIEPFEESTERQWSESVFFAQGLSWRLTSSAASS